MYEVNQEVSRLEKCFRLEKKIFEPARMAFFYGFTLVIWMVDPQNYTNLLEKAGEIIFWMEKRGIITWDQARS